MRMTRAVLLAALLLHALSACRRLDPGPDVQRALTTYAPDLVLGAPVSDSARRRYHLKVEAYLGYRDSAFTTLDGLRNLGIGVNEYVDDNQPRVDAGARIAFIGFMSPDSLSSTRAEARLRSMLGRPREECYSLPLAGPWRRLYWPGKHGRGVLLVVVLPRTFNPPATRAGLPTGRSYEVRPPGAGAVTFGAEEPDNKDVQLLSCGAQRR